MSREIKFRYHSNADRKMYQLSLLELCTHLKKDPCVYVGSHVPSKFSEDRRVQRYSDGHVMQYAGLEDENGKEIYEDDFLEVETYEGEKHIVRVIFDDGCFCYISYLGDLRTYPLRDFLFNGSKLRVIGNIYENPELLENA